MDTPIGRDTASRGAEELFPVLYEELRSLAAAQLARLSAGGTLQPTVLVHEAYLKLIGRTPCSFDERRHFFAAAARAMRDLVIDHARRKGASKRGGGEPRLRLEDTAIDIAAQSLGTDDALALNAAITRLEAEYPRKAEVVLLRHFGGLSHDEIATLLGVTTRTIEREWRFARAYLHAQLASEA